MGQIVSGYLDFAERQAEREQVMTVENDYLNTVKMLGTLKQEPKI